MNYDSFNPVKHHSRQSPLRSLSICTRSCRSGESLVNSIFSQLLRYCQNRYGHYAQGTTWTLTVKPLIRLIGVTQYFCVALHHVFLPWWYNQAMISRIVWYETINNKYPEVLSFKDGTNMTFPYASHIKLNGTALPGKQGILSFIHIKILTYHII